MLETNCFHKGIVEQPGGWKEICWIEDAVKEWLGGTDDVLEGLHLCSFEGFLGPPRGPEFASTLIRNIPGRRCNIHVINKIMTFIHRYNKSAAITRTDNLITRRLFLGPPKNSLSFYHHTSANHLLLSLQGL